jgi:nitrate reductase gamma subunit
MRLALPDLLIAMVAFLFGAIAIQVIYHVFGFPMTRSSPLEYAFGMVAGLAIYLAVTPIIYRRLKMRPLWYPPLSDLSGQEPFLGI